MPASEKAIALALHDRQYFSDEPSSYRPARLSRRDRLHGFWWLWGGSASLAFISAMLACMAGVHKENAEGYERMVGMALWLTCPVALGPICFVVSTGFTCAFRRQFFRLARPRHLVPLLATCATYALCIWFITYAEDWSFGLNKRDHLSFLYVILWAAFYASQLWYNASFATPLKSLFGRGYETVGMIDLDKV
ncbi:uncharacterized protein LOC62_04G005840 [Vanrija pseudolonga]|uniref:Uncharacterized protein n=1 Tax=Vanrija pseudolonga TaxID=143232 RepID=A0AAF1BII7_9TREE|nr:hypothetical protein LOC62_04G005840 [Vanrija pseudolonga]